MAFDASLISPCVRGVAAWIGLVPLGRWKTEVARYGQAYKDRIVARLLPPESSSVEHVSREVGVSMATLQRGRPRWPMDLGCELLAISGAYLDDDACAHVADSHLPASRGILIRTHPYGFIH